MRASVREADREAGRWLDAEEFVRWLDNHKPDQVMQRLGFAAFAADDWAAAFGEGKKKAAAARAFERWKQSWGHPSGFLVPWDRLDGRDRDNLESALARADHRTEEFYLVPLEGLATKVSQAAERRDELTKAARAMGGRKRTYAHDATLEEAARSMGVKVDTIRGWIKRSGLPHTKKPGKRGKIYLSVSEAEAWASMHSRAYKVAQTTSPLGEGPLVPIEKARPRLLEIRNLLNLSNGYYAELLGVTPSMLQVWFGQGGSWRRRRTVPSGAMERAEELLRTMKPRAFTKTHLQKITLEQILKAWEKHGNAKDAAKELGISAGAFVVMAEHRGFDMPAPLVERITRRDLEALLERHKGVRVRMAEEVGVSPQYITMLLKEAGLYVQPPASAARRHTIGKEEVESVLRTAIMEGVRPHAAAKQAGIARASILKRAAKRHGLAALYEEAERGGNVKAKKNPPKDDMDAALETVALAFGVDVEHVARYPGVYPHDRVAIEDNGSGSIVVQIEGLRTRTFRKGRRGFSVAGIVKHVRDAVGGELTNSNPPRFLVRSPAQGLKTIQHRDITQNYERALRIKPSHDKAVLVPCAGTKPFPDAPSHKHGYLAGLEGKPLDMFVVSEPLGVVPYAWSREYPQADYDFPPHHLRGPGRELLADRIADWFEKVAPKYKVVYLALPGHHRRLVLHALEQFDSPPVRIKDIGLGACLDSGACPPGNVRPTTKAYRKFLKTRANPGKRPTCPDCERKIGGLWRTGVCDECKHLLRKDLPGDPECYCHGTGYPVCCRCEGTGEDPYPEDRNPPPRMAGPAFFGSRRIPVDVIRPAWSGDLGYWDVVFEDGEEGTASEAELYTTSGERWRAPVPRHGRQPWTNPFGYSASELVGKVIGWTAAGATADLVTSQIAKFTAPIEKGARRAIEKGASAVVGRNPPMKICDPNKRPLRAGPLKGEFVRTHVNLHNGCFVVSYKSKVQGYARALKLKDVRPRVGRAGWERCNASQVRNVHAFLDGELVSGKAAKKTGGGWREISYHCKTHGPHFFFVDTDEPFLGAKEVICRKAMVGGVEKAQVFARGPEPARKNPADCECGAPEGVCSCGEVDSWIEGDPEKVTPCGSPPRRVGVHVVDRPWGRAILVLDAANVEAYTPRDWHERGRCPLLAGFSILAGDGAGTRVARDSMHDELMRHESSGRHHHCSELARLAARCQIQLEQAEDMLCQEGVAWHHASHGRVAKNP